MNAAVLAWGSWEHNEDRAHYGTLTGMWWSRAGGVSWAPGHRYMAGSFRDAESLSAITHEYRRGE